MQIAQSKSGTLFVLCSVESLIDHLYSEDSVLLVQYEDMDKWSTIDGNYRYLISDRNIL